MIETGESIRGWLSGDFKDGNGHGCSIQESSACRDEGMLWLGMDTPVARIMRPGKAWADVEMPTDGTLLHCGRMHLTQTMVADLLPLLTYFAAHGALPRDDVELPAGIGCPCCRAGDDA